MEPLVTLSPEDVRQLSRLAERMRTGLLSLPEFGRQVILASQNGTGKIRAQAIVAAFRMSDLDAREFLGAIPTAFQEVAADAIRTTG